MNSTKIHHCRRCDVDLCTNHSGNCNLSFFRIPDDPEKLSKWTEFITFKPSEKKATFVCASHFEMKCFSNTFRRRLLRFAVPTIQSSIVSSELQHSIDNEYVHDTQTASEFFSSEFQHSIDDKDIYKTQTAPENSLHKVQSSTDGKDSSETQTASYVVYGIPDSTNDEDMSETQTASKFVLHELQCSMDDGDISKTQTAAEPCLREVQSNTTNDRNISIAQTAFGLNKSSNTESLQDHAYSSFTPFSTECFAYDATARARKMNALRLSLYRLKTKALVQLRKAAKTNKSRALQTIKELLPPDLYSIVESQIVNYTIEPKGRRWGKFIKTFASKIFFTSGTAYRLLSKCMLLPAISTLRENAKDEKIDAEDKMDEGEEVREATDCISEDRAEVEFQAEKSSIIKSKKQQKSETKENDGDAFAMSILNPFFNNMKRFHSDFEYVLKENEQLKLEIKRLQERLPH